MAARLNFTAHDERDTERLGRALAEVVRPGDVICLIGALGSGKTRLVQAAAAALGVPPGAVSSPTFVLVNEYAGGRLPVYHFDTYRLKDEDEFLALGPDEYFEAGGLSFVEWADRVRAVLPRERLEITFEILGDTQRTISVRGTSPATEELAGRIAAAVGAH